MTKFDSADQEQAPTRLIRSKNKKTDKRAAVDNATMLIKKTSTVDAATININQQPLGSQTDTTAISGANINSSTEIEQSEPAKHGSKTVLVRRSAELTELATVGWLVVIDGPGKGKSLAFSYGRNKIGRDSSQHIALIFGDDEISRIEHAAIEFDPKPRKFYLSKGENLVYLNGERVGSGSEKELTTADEIVIGATTLRFVAFCGEDFDWPKD